MRIITLQWAVGMFCAVIGSMMITVPHHYDIPAYAALAPHLMWWGAAFLLAGNGLLALAVFTPPRWLVIAVHLVAGGVLLVLARGFAAAGTWIALNAYAILAVGTAIAPFIPQATRRDDRSGGRHLFGLVMGLEAIGAGLILLAFPAQFRASLYDLVRPHLLWYGVAFAGGGVALVGAQIPGLGRWSPRILYPIGAAPFLAFFVKTALLTNNWNRIAYYGGFGVALALLPWVGTFLEAVRSTSLRVRIALALAAAAAAPLIVAVGFVTEREERSATQQALVLQQTLAGSLAQQIADFIAFHRVSVIALADSIGFSRLSPVQEVDLLRTFGREYPDVLAFSTYDAAGRPRARSDGRTPHVISGFPVFDNARRTNAVSVDIYVSPALNQLVFGFGAPVRDPDGRFAGLALAAVDPSSIVNILGPGSARIEGIAYLVDEKGHMIASGDYSVYAQSTDLSQAPPVALMHAQPQTSGHLAFESEGGTRLAGYARVPDSDWGIVVERPRAAALAGADQAREYAFILHLLIMGMAALAGILLAGAIAKPLELLASQVSRFDEGTSHEPFPRSTVAEVNQLSTAFDEMRTRLATRTAERERAEQQRTEMLLRERQLANHVRLLLESTAEGIMGLDPRGNCTFVNRTGAAMLGYAPEELLGRHMHPVIHHSHADGSPYPAEDCPIYRAFRDGKGCRVDNEVLWRRDGTAFAAEYSSHPMTGNGEIEGVVVTFDDITGRRRNEAALRTNEERIRLIIETAQDAFVGMDAAGVITAWNAQAEQTFGWTRQEAVGRNLADTLIPAEHRAAHQQGIKHFLSTGEGPILNKRIEITALHRDGHEFPVELTISPTRLGDEYIFNAFIRDISTRKHAEQVLRDREARIRAIMESTSDGIIFIGLYGRIQAANRRAGLLLGQPLEWVPKGDLGDLLAAAGAGPAAREALLAAIKSLREGEAASGEGELELSTTRRAVHWDAQPTWSAAGAIEGITLTLQDVTQAREVSRMKSDFVSFVTHQLRTPLSGIKWMLELATETQEGTDLRAYIEDARDANQRLIDLVNDLLDISRLESGRLSLSPQELDLAKLTQSVLAELEPIIRERGHRLSVAGAENLPPVQADPQLLRQAVLNLLSNAIKYTPPGGEIVLQMDQENGAVTWAVRDTGIGIPKSALPRLFEKFYRAENVTKLETEGTGLGLYLVQLIIERHGGRIWCESEEGKGSTFHLELPLQGGN